MMRPTDVRVGIMDSTREGAVATVPVLHLSRGARTLRSLKRLLLVSGVGAVLIPVPLIHVCGAVVAVIVGPLAAAWAFRTSAVMGDCQVPCPKCNQPVTLSSAHTGWPVRVQCMNCSAMVELSLR